MPDHVNFNYNLNSEPLAAAEWYQRREGGALNMVSSTSYPCKPDNDPMDSPLTPIMIDDHDGGALTMLYEVAGKAVVLARLGHGSVGLSSAARTMPEAEAAIEAVEAILPRQEITDNGRIPITFWAYTPNGPLANTRELSVPKWEEIRDFYNAEEREEIDRLVSPDFVPGLGGQLLLWRGVPGTGKTTALRALGYEWREWAQLHVIADPERFFGDHADYMLQVMLGAGDVGAVHLPKGVYRMEGRRRGAKEEVPKWRILILEDAGELLVKDSKQKVGQALSRFLNAVDGLIGQGLRFLVLVTTNEDDMGQLNEAVGRHGRAAVNTEFKELGTQQVERVLAILRQRAGTEDEDFADVVGPMPLADIFAIHEGRTRAEKPTPVGFGVPADG